MNPSGPLARRSRLVSFVAWLSILGGALGVLGAAPIVLTQPSLRAIVVLVDAASYIVTGLGLRARREWARRAYIFVLAYSTLMAIVGAFRFRLPAASAFPQPPGDSAPALTQQQVDAITAQMRPMVFGVVVVATIINGLLIAWLCTRKIRAEFDAEMPPDGSRQSAAMEAVPVPQRAVTVHSDDRASRTGWPPIV